MAETNRHYIYVDGARVYAENYDTGKKMYVEYNTGDESQEEINRIAKYIEDIQRVPKEYMPVNVDVDCSKGG